MRLWFLIVPLGVAWVVLRSAEIAPGTIVNWPAALWAVVVAIVSWMAGVLGAALVGWLVLGPIYYGRTIANGGPFQIGDTVQVISGPFKDRVARVYDSWRENAVCVELGEEAKAAYRDVFGGHQLLLVSRTLPTPPQQ